MSSKEWAKLIGLNVSQRRRRQFLTREQLADRIGVDRTYITKIENGSRCPSIETMLRLAEKLYLKDWRELLDDSERIASNGVQDPI